METLANVPAWLPIVVAIPLALVLGAARVQASIYSGRIVVIGLIASGALLLIN